jgi:DNA-binding transcriptional LysR family regulator
MNTMHINELDLNLLRLFDAVHRLRSVSRAADALGLTQPAASHGLGRLRLLLNDALFERTAGGVKPTPRAERLAVTVRQALSALQVALDEPAAFDPRQSTHTFRLHMSDMGESRFLPPLMTTLRQQAPGVRVQTFPLPSSDIAPALDEGRIDFAFGFLPMVKDTQRAQLLTDRYIVLLRKDHPFAATAKRKNGKALLDALRALEFVVGRTHAATLRILQELKLEDRIRLTTEHFLALPAIVGATDLAVLMPLQIAEGFAASNSYTIIEPTFPRRDFIVSLHWSHRHHADPAKRWLKELLMELFARRSRG